MRNLLAASAAGAALTFLAAGAALADPGVTLAASCTLTPGGHCLFDGNITTTNLSAVDTAYNSQNPPSALELTNFADVGEYDASGGNKIYSGTVNASFTVDYFAVKAGDQFELYELSTPSTSFSWNTNDLVVGNNSTPSLSHIIYVGSATVPGGVPEPATWAMMILGFFGLGGALRSRRKGAGLAAA